jgi:glycerophosphoryl diester phosphodiesterase
VHPLLDLTARPVVGHRGNRAHAPENTLESFRQAVALGVDALEFDVRISSDGAVVVFHDPTTARTTGAPGDVPTRTLAELKALDAGATFSPDGGRTFPYRGRGVGIPTLEEVLVALPDTPVLVEIKVAEAAVATREILARCGAAGRAVVASFIPEALHPFEQSGIARCATPSDLIPMYLPALLGRRYHRLPFQLMSLPRFYRGIPVPLRALARATAPAGVPLHVWTVNQPSHARRLWLAGVRGILSDDPATILAERARLGPGR